MKLWKMFLSLFALIGDQKGQIAANDGGDSGGDDGGAGGAAGDDGGAGDDLDKAQKSDDGDFLSGTNKKADIMARINANPELKEAHGWMQSAYQKALGKTKGAEQRLAMVDRFENDPQFAHQVVQQWATQNGFSLSKADAANVARALGSNGGPAPSGAPQAVIDAVSAQLDPSVQWMAPAIAAGQYAAHQLTIKPIEERQKQERQSVWAEEFERTADELSHAVPGWEEHEDEMTELLDWLRSDRVSHKKFGSKLKFLYNAITGNSQAIQEATRRFGSAATSRTATGQPGRSTVPNVADRVLKAKTHQDAFAIAAQAAAEQLEKEGRRLG